MTNDMTMAAPAAGETTSLSKAEKFAALATKMDELADAAQGAFALKGNFVRTIALGKAMADLRDALDDKVMVSIMKLKNTQVGFRTDERPASKYAPEIYYGVDVVREAVIQACVLGLQCVGNQFNILAKRFYVTKEGFIYLLRNLPGLTDLMLTFHPAEIRQSSTDYVNREGERKQKIEREGIARVDMSWTWHGKSATKTLEFCLRVNDGMSQDAVIGKAERKARKWLYEYLTDNAIADADVSEVEEIRDVTPNRPAGVTKPVAARLAATPAAKPDVVVVEVAATPAAKPTQEESVAPAPDEEQQAATAFDWLSGSIQGSGASWQRLYRALEAAGFAHPATGASRTELSRFALSVFRSAEMREVLEQSGFVFGK